jgi:thiamine kinase-like enzyme
MNRDVRGLIENYYDINVSSSEAITKKAVKLVNEDGTPYFFKRTSYNAPQKYQFLASLGISNILFPILNKNNQYVTQNKYENFYLSNFVNDYTLVAEVKAVNMVNELQKLHEKTSFSRQLSPRTARPKFEELTAQLDYKFKLIEEFVRSVESKPLGVYSMPILSNYHHILDAKTELARLQKRLISRIKEKESVDYTFVHNNPKLDHLLNVRGARYLTSIENGKVGISSLDLAKFYLENEDLNIDMNSIIQKYFGKYDNDFYLDYFRYLVLFMSIKRIIVTDLDYISAQNFINSATSLKRYFDQFSITKKKVSE